MQASSARRSTSSRTGCGSGVAISERVPSPTGRKRLRARPERRGAVLSRAYAVGVRTMFVVWTVVLAIGIVSFMIIGLSHR
jgi:hypothetical protein